MAKNLSEVLGRPIEAVYAEQYRAGFPADAGTPMEHVDIAAKAYGQGLASRVSEVRVSRTVFEWVSKARKHAIDPIPLLLQAAEEAANQGRRKITNSGPTAEIVGKLGASVQGKEFEIYRAEQIQKPLGRRRA